MSEARTPLVSFLLAVHNDARFLPDTLASMLGQTFTDFEIIAIDDASIDATAQILKSAGDVRLRYFRNENNIGQVPSLNRGLKLCRGELIARIDGDDLCEAERLAAQVRYLADHPRLAGCATWTTEIDEAGNVIGAVEPCDDPDYIRWSLCHTLRLYHPSMMLRRRVYNQAGGYDERYPSTEDYELWTRLVADGDLLGVVSRPLIRYRRRAGSITDTNRLRHHHVGRQIATRFVSHLLGRPCHEQVVGTMRSLLAWKAPEPAELPSEQVGDALALMAELRQATLHRATAAARASADHEVAQHLLRKGQLLLKEAPRSSARLARYVARLPGHRIEGATLMLRAARCMLGRRARERRAR